MISTQYFEEEMRRMESCLEGPKWNKAKLKEVYDRIFANDPQDLTQAIDIIIETEDRSSIRKLLAAFRSVKLKRWDRTKQEEHRAAQRIFRQGKSDDPNIATEYCTRIVNMLSGVISKSDVAQFLVKKGYEYDAAILEELERQTDLSDIPF